MSWTLQHWTLTEIRYKIDEHQKDGKSTGGATRPSTWCTTPQLRFKTFICNLKMLTSAQNIYPSVKLAKWLSLCITFSGLFLISAAEIHSHLIRQSHIHSPSPQISVSPVLLLLFLSSFKRSREFSGRGPIHLWGIDILWVASVFTGFIFHSAVAGCYHADLKHHVSYDSGFEAYGKQKARQKLIFHNGKKGH